MSQDPGLPTEVVAEPALPPLPKHGRSYDEPTRGGWLTFLLAMTFVGNAGAAITYLLVLCGVVPFHGKSLWIALAYLALTITNITAIGAIWEWQRWGLYLLFVSALVIFFMNISLGLLRWSTGIGLIGPLLIAAAMWSRWETFE